MQHVVVDAANVVGSRPDGWWRDRAGAAGRLAGRLVAALAEPEALAGALGITTPMRLHLVLEGAARAAQIPAHPDLEVVSARADGDAAIAATAAALVGHGPVLVVTADRALRARVRAAGAQVSGPGALLAALPAEGGAELPG